MKEGRKVWKVKEGKERKVGKEGRKVGMEAARKVEDGRKALKEGGEGRKDCMEGKEGKR